MIYSNVTDAVIDLKGNNIINCQITVKNVEYPVTIQYTVNKFEVRGQKVTDCTDAHIAIGSYPQLCEEDEGDGATIFYDEGDSFTITLNSKKQFVFNIELTGT